MLGSWQGVKGRKKVDNPWSMQCFICNENTFCIHVNIKNNDPFFDNPDSD